MLNEGRHHREESGDESSVDEGTSSSLGCPAGDEKDRQEDMNEQEEEEGDDKASQHPSRRSLHHCCMMENTCRRIRPAGWFCLLRI